MSAVKLIEENAKSNQDGKLSSEDMLAIVTLLLTRSEPASRSRAAALLEQLQEQRPDHQLLPREQSVLAQLYERTGKWPQRAS